MGRVVSMEDALRQGDDPEPVFTISFDDGFRTTYAVAGSILSRRGIPSTIFIATEFVGLSGAALESFTRDRLNWPHAQPAITADEVRACASRGMQVGSHGVTHKAFSGMDDTEAASELKESRETLERLSGQPVRYFAWPFGSLPAFPSRFLELAKQTGYEAVYSGVSRTAPNLPTGIQARRELNLSWGVRICAYLARRG
jgi:peptidoglycan/xylan/chitin deacetylase (PgdA/CDA1 family)